MARWRIRLRGVGPQLEGKFWESDKTLRVGRLENLEVVFNDSSISRRHAEVVATDQGWMVRDLGSTNGTFLNGVRVGRADRRLRLRDQLQCGNMVMIVAVLEEDVLPSVESPGSNMQVQATAQQTWEKALEVLAFDSNKRPRPGEKLLTLMRAGHHLGHIGSLDELLRSVLDDAVSVLDAQRGSIVMVDEDTNELKLRSVSTGDKETGGRSHFSKSLAQRCFQRGESLLCRDVGQDPELLVARSIADGTMSSIICALLRTPRKPLGVLHLDRGPFQNPFDSEDLHLADAVAASVSAGIECAQLLEKQRTLFINTVTALAQAVELRDPYTGGHTQRVTDYSLMLGEELNLSHKELYHLQIGGPLHDIGKIGIDDAILRKPDKLTYEEFEQMKSHTTKGADMLKTLPDLAPIIPIVRNHHEKWNGTGYPDGLAGDKIPLLARILAVGDAFDAMTSDRPYRPGKPPEWAFGEIERGMGEHFDPDCARGFLNLRTQIEDAMQNRLDPESGLGLPRRTWNIRAAGVLT